MTDSSCEGMKLVLLGCAQDSGNLGVSALGLAAIELLERHLPGAEIALEVRKFQPHVEVTLPSGSRTLNGVRLCYLNKLRGKHGTKFIGTLLAATRYMPEVIATRVVSPNLTAARLYESDAVLDVSAGDSFAEIYGEWRFEDELSRKRLVIDAGRNLVLLPQTFGPFLSESGRERAASVIEGALVAATREVGGIDEAVVNLGNAAAGKLSLCPDMAFALTPRQVADEAEPWLAGGGEYVGLNVSGLLWKRDPKEFGLRSDYTELTRRLSRQFLAKSGMKLLLVPHVNGTEPLSTDRSTWPNVSEYDNIACYQLADELVEEFPGRVEVVKGFYDAAQTKYLIGKCCFFVGARMHACIGAASQAVPHVLLAYSKKAKGVFGVLGDAGCVVDPRGDDLETCLSKIETAFAHREAQATALRKILPDVRGSIDQFFSGTLRPALIRNRRLTAR